MTRARCCPQVGHDGLIVPRSGPGTASRAKCPTRLPRLLHWWPVSGLVEWTDGTHTLRELQEEEAAS